MLKIHPQHIQAVQSAQSLKELFPLVQNAIELEHATVPPYLTAMFSIKPGKARDIWNIIHSIVIEEMLHMTISSNIMNAIGGSPAIDNAKFVPEYPGGLPMGIGDGLVVNLEKLTKDVVKNTFMAIEEPEDPIPIPVEETAEALTAKADTPEFHTIGEFYDYLNKKIQELAPENLPGDPSRQVTSKFFSSDVLFPILTKEDVTRAINIIVEQGEGTSTTPIDLEGEIAHYYRFEEIYVGKALVVTTNPDGSQSFAYSGAPITFTADDVFPTFPNTKAAMLEPGSQERRRLDEFNQTYGSLLSGLHRTFNGEPTHLDQTIGLMFDIKLLAEKLCGTPFPGKTGYTIGPSFEFKG
ncbi:MAG: ferritin-like protein [Crocinitomicaceae bacterium]